MEKSQLTVSELEKMGNVLFEQVKKLEMSNLTIDVLTTQNIMMAQIGDNDFYNGLYRKQVNEFLDLLHLSTQEMIKALDHVCFMLLNCTDKKEIDGARELKEL